MIIHCSFATKVSFALHQNSVPVLLDLSVENDTDTAVEDVTLSLTATPDFFRPRTWRLSKLSPGQRRPIDDRDLLLDGGHLSRLTEAEKGLVRLELRKGDDLLAELDLPVELLARNQWGGLNQFPEVTAAFVCPNDPAVDRILKKTSDLLLKAGKAPALQGYETGGKRRVWEIMSGLWQAVCSLGLDYSLPPAGFEQQGQKVRSPEHILSTGIGTCLDLSFLFASCLEQCQLHPLLVFIEGHAFAGCWLAPETFSTTVIDDVAALRKRIQLQEILLFETTLTVRGQQAPPKLKWSCEVGAKQISEEESRPFQFALDIKRARMERIRPLSSEDAAVRADAADATLAIEPDLTDLDESPELIEVETAVTAKTHDKPKDRLEQWQRKLLDLSLRNNLLNFRASRRVVGLFVPEPGRLEDLLADGKRFKLRPGIRLAQADPRDETIHQARHREEISREHAMASLDKGELFTQLDENEMERRLVELFRASRLALQEGGANTLYLVLGFLVWTQDGKDARRLRAPLILIPVHLDRQAVRSGFSLTLHEDEPRFNLTLLEMLRQDFHLNIPGISGELPRDDSGLDVAAIWRTVAVAIKDMPGWEVAQEVCLGQFSFAKYLMWKDLAERTDQLRTCPVVRHLIDTPTQTYADRADFVAPQRLDKILPPEQNYCPLPADSSQLSAVLAAAKGQDFVLEGPPGTGKSQTIANLIAQCLAMNKTVLFVAEKTAALNVVYRRLRAVGLGEFCLELHSNKANKLNVLTQLKESWEAKVNREWETWNRETARMGTLRERLNALVKALHRPWRNELSVFSAISKTLSGRDIPDLGFSWPGPDTHEPADLDAMLDIATRLGINAGQVDKTAREALALVTHTEWSPGWEHGLTTSLREIMPLCEQAQQAAEAFFAATGLPEVSIPRHGREALASLAALLPQAAGRDLGFVLRPDAPDIFSRLRHGQALLAKRSALLEGLRKHDTALTGQYALKPASPSLWAPLETAAREIFTALHEFLCQAENHLTATSATGGMESLRERIAALKAEAEDTATDFLARLERGNALDAGRQELCGRLCLAYRPEAFQLDLAGLRQAWGEACRSIWPKSALGQRKIRKTLHAVAGESLSANPDYGQDIELLLAIRELDGDLAAFADLRDQDTGAWAWSDQEAKAKAFFDWMRSLLVLATATHEVMAALRQEDEALLRLSDLGPLTGHLWAGLDTRAEDIALAQTLGDGLTRYVAALYDRPDSLAGSIEALTRLFGAGHLLLAPSGALARAGNDFSDASSRLQAATQSLAALLGPGEAPARALDALTPAAIAARGKDILANTRALRAWCAWNRVAGEARARGLVALVTALEQGDIANGLAKAAFAVNYCRWWLRAAVDTEPLLTRFVAAEHEQAIADFRQLDQRLAELARDCIRANLRKSTPESQDVHKTSEWGILRREMEKKRRHMPLRQLMDKLPTALPSLTPCLLMSPLSIAQYLPPGKASFDLVVFDEASQIPVWDAIGAMARGRRVIVVGDPKQLPPTNFFNRAEDEDADDEVEIGGDMESILDECLSAGLPRQRLNWHYRSRHESLIAFSNHRYYGGSLVTFPSPVTDDRAVSMTLVEGAFYDKGGSRTNQAEAKAVVADIMRRLNDPGFVATGWSIGVVTFNSQQQKLIEDLLDEERRKNPTLDRFFTDDLAEPVFVKNLENVQGDERDLMYFSITYGPDQSGRVSMNFGPLNKDGGERRLNVAVTRAKHQLRVFTCLSPDHIELSRTKAKGVADLKLFLEYARRGSKALVEEVAGSTGDFDSPFEEIVADALSRRGWTVHPQVGVSSFRIDLGVVDPDRPGGYLVGVECDGAAYHRAATARDRDKLREQVLRGLGWEIVRTWSTDWWYDAESAAERLDAALRAVLERTRDERAKREEELAPEQACAVEPENPPLNHTPPRQAVHDTPEADSAGPATSNTDHETHPAPDVPIPQAAALQAPPPGADADSASCDLLAAGREQALLDAIREIVGAEGPIRADVLARRIAKRCGFYKAGAKIREQVLRAATREFQAVAEEGGVFVWPQGSIPGQWASFRAKCGGEPRPVDEICLAELVALARELHPGLKPDEDPMAAMAHAAGLQRLRAVTRERLEKAWQGYLASMAAG